MIQKLIVTNVGALKRKYGAAGLTLIRKAVTRLVAADALRGIKTTLEAVDSPTRSAPKVTVFDNPQQVKATIDKLYAAYKSPDYLLILGGPDVIPHQALVNPMFSPNPDDDNDRNVPSDLPYACAAPFSTNISDFIGPTRVVGRLADVTGSTKVEELVSVIDGATTFSGTPNKNSFALSAGEWAGASRANVKLAFGASPSRPVEMVPPKSPPWKPAQLASPLYFINCHGADRDPRFFGSSTADFPTALEASGLVGQITRGSIIAAECCYGAQLYKRTATFKLGIANTCFLQGAAGYCGSTNIAYGAAAAKDRSAADILCVEFIKAVMAKASLGRAMLEARQKFVTASKGAVDPADEKTLGQFLLLGDPSLRPFGAGLDPGKVKGLPKSLAKAGAVKAMPMAAHRAKRRKLELAGNTIARTKPVAVRVAATAKSAAGVGSMLESRGLTPSRTLTFRVELPAARKVQSKGKAKSAPASSLESMNTELIQVTFVGNPSRGLESAKSMKKKPPAGVVDIHAVITRTRGGQVLSYKRISSK